MNNMQHIRKEMSQFEDKLELQSFYDWLEAEEKLGTPFRDVVKNFSKSADEDINNKMDQIMLEIAEKVLITIYPLLCSFNSQLFSIMQLSPDIQHFVHDIISNEGDITDEKVRAVCFMHCS